jgi:Zn-dependent protease with chaperone function
MDFFEAQARAKKRSGRLVALFIIAVIGTIIGGYLASIILLSHAPKRYGGSSSSTRYYQAAPAPLKLWQPGVFATISVGTLLVVGLASLFKWHEFSAGGSAVAESVGGRAVDPHTIDLRERKLLNVVEEMAIASGIPMPAVYVLDQEPGINAFAAGLTTSDAVVTVTRGALEKLTREELQGVIGHEFSHILNGDMRLNLQLSALVFGILVIGLAGRGILWAMSRGRIRGDSKNGGGAVIAIGAVGLALLILGYVGYFFGKLIQAAVSRQREFLADASSVQFTRNPNGLTGALKKIGGFALGSSLASNKSATIGHFFFAQAFQSNFGGLWATHPPLDQRIRAIDPQFDGTMFDPPEVVDVSRESFAQAGFAPGAVDHSTLKRPAPPAPSPAAIVATIGTLAPANITHAEGLLASVPTRLRDAARSPTEAPVLLYGLLLDPNEAARERQLSLVASKAGADARRILGELDPALRLLGPEHRLPLLQLTLPALRNLPPAALAPFLDTLDELVHADGKVSTFEFALQKTLTRTLALGRKPDASVEQIFSFNAVPNEINVVLSALAYTAANSGLSAADAFAIGADQLKLLEGKLTLLPPAACTFVQLDAALDRLATASGPIKQRLLAAAAHLVGADGSILIAEAELLRAIASALGVPMPPLLAAA